MRPVAVIAALLVLIVSAVMAATSDHGIDSPALEVTRVRADDLGDAVTESFEQSESPTATISTLIRSPNRFFIRGHVVPGHNRGIQLWAHVICFGSGGLDEYQQDLTKGTRDRRDGLSITLDVHVRHSDLCSINAIANPAVGVVARFPKQAFARVSLHCPTGCVLDKPEP